MGIILLTVLGESDGLRQRFQIRNGVTVPLIFKVRHDHNSQGLGYLRSCRELLYPPWS